MEAEQVAEQLEHHTGVEWHAMRTQVRCNASDSLPGALTGFFRVRWHDDDLQAQFVLGLSEPGDPALGKVTVKGDDNPVEALDMLTDRLGFRPADVVAGNPIKPPTLVLEPIDHDDEVHRLDPSGPDKGRWHRVGGNGFRWHDEGRCWQQLPNWGGRHSIKGRDTVQTYGGREWRVQRVYDNEDDQSRPDIEDTVQKAIDNIGDWTDEEREAFFERQEERAEKREGTVPLGTAERTEDEDTPEETSLTDPDTDTLIARLKSIVEASGGGSILVDPDDPLSDITAREDLIETCLGLFEQSARRLRSETGFSNPESATATSPRLNDQCRGCLLGLAVGDMVGAPIEKQGRDASRSFIQDHLRPMDFEGVRRTAFEDLSFGWVTDDTQMARALVKTHLRVMAPDGARGFGPVYRETLLDLFESDRIVGAGQGTRQAVDRLRDGTPWWAAGSSGGGNGSAMRAAPVGLMAISTASSLMDPATLAQRLAATQGILTHRSAVGVAGGEVMALAAYQMAGTGDLSLEDLADRIEPRHDEFAHQLRQLHAHLQCEASAEEVLSHVDSLQRETSWDVIAPYAMSSVLWALYAVQSSDSFLDTIERAIWAGGDVDSTAAMAGSLRGIRDGFDAIPETLLNHLRDEHGEHARSRLTQLADRWADAMS